MGKTIEQAFVYKGDKAELHDKDVADRMKDEEGWFDNPADAKKPTKPATKITIPTKDDSPSPDSTPDEDVNDASGTPFNADRHYKDKRTDENGNWAVKKNAK